MKFDWFCASDIQESDESTVVYSKSYVPICSTDRIPLNQNEPSVSQLEVLDLALIWLSFTCKLMRHGTASGVSFVALVKMQRTVLQGTALHGSQKGHWNIYDLRHFWHFLAFFIFFMDFCMLLFCWMSVARMKAEGREQRLVGALDSWVVYYCTIVILM